MVYDFQLSGKVVKNILIFKEMPRRIAGTAILFEYNNQIVSMLQVNGF